MMPGWAIALLILVGYFVLDIIKGVLGNVLTNPVVSRWEKRSKRAAERKENKDKDFELRVRLFQLNRHMYYSTIAKDMFLAMGTLGAMVLAASTTPYLAANLEDDEPITSWSSFNTIAGFVISSLALALIMTIVHRHTLLFSAIRKLDMEDFEERYVKPSEEKRRLAEEAEAQVQSKLEAQHRRDDHMEDGVGEPEPGEP